VLTSTEDTEALDAAQAATEPSRFPSTFDRDHSPTEFGRVLALSDGVFAIALTLLVLDLALPLSAPGSSLRDEIAGRQTHFIAFAVSLLLVGSSWGSHHRLFTMLQRVDGTLLSLNIVYLGLVVLIPFAQTVLAGHLNDPFAFVLFAGIIAGVGITDGTLYVYARHKRMLRIHLPTRANRIELLRSVALVATFLISMPLAWLLGPYTMILWFAQMPADRILVHIQERPPA